MRLHTTVICASSRGAVYLFSFVLLRNIYNNQREGERTGKWVDPRREVAHFLSGFVIRCNKTSLFVCPWTHPPQCYKDTEEFDVKGELAEEDDSRGSCSNAGHSTKELCQAAGEDWDIDLFQCCGDNEDCLTGKSTGAGEPLWNGLLEVHTILGCAFHGHGAVDALVATANCCVNKGLRFGDLDTSSCPAPTCKARPPYTGRDCDGIRSPKICNDEHHKKQCMWVAPGSSCRQR